MNLLEQIKARYPNPIKIDSEGDVPDCYCIGGAVCMFAGTYSVSGFPPTEKVAYALTTLNPNLSHTQAKEFSELITGHNDAGDFDWSWQMVGLALAA